MFISGLKPSYFHHDQYDDHGDHKKPQDHNVKSRSSNTMMSSDAAAAAASESGYESLLLSSSLTSTNCSFFYSSDSNSSSSISSSNSLLFSQPSTPVKQQQSLFKVPTSASKQQQHQYVADINGIYFASLKSPAKPVGDVTTQFKSSQSSSSSSTSPVKQQILNPDDYIRERDPLKTKLLRSPAFKINPCLSPSPYSVRHHHQQASTTPYIKPFSSRFSSSHSATNNGKIEEESATPESSTSARSISSTTTTPTEEEFMQMLFKNRHLPYNPEFLIGRRMGVDYVDILSELNKRSMHFVIEQIFSHLPKVDLARVGCVSSEWRRIIKQDKKHNKIRSKFLKHKQRTYETGKENLCTCSSNTSAIAVSASTSAEDQHRHSHNNKALTASNVEFQPTPTPVAFASLDLNCILQDNPLSSLRRYLAIRQEKQQQQQQAMAMIEIVESEKKNSEESSEQQQQQQHQQSIAKSSGDENKERLENQFHDFSLSDIEMMCKEDEEKETLMHPASAAAFVIKSEIVQSKRSPLKAIKLAETPKFVSKNLKIKSPAKIQHQPFLLQSSIANAAAGSGNGNEKIDLIGSKKSKKNLKRL